jgi:hypothetical protein
LVVQTRNTWPDQGRSSLFAELLTRLLTKSGSPR